MATEDPQPVMPVPAPMPTALAQRDVLGKGMIPRTVEDGWRLASAFAESGMVPKDMAGKANAVFAAICLGAELGMPPMSAVQNIYVVNGRPTVWGDAMLGICQRSGVFDHGVFQEGYGGTEGKDDFFAFTEVCRIGTPNAVREQFSIADARKARLWGKDGTWTTHPKRMLKYRARSFALRQAFADVLKGLYTAEEMIDVEPTRAAFVAPVATETQLFDEYRKTPETSAGEAETQADVQATATSVPVEAPAGPGAAADARVLGLLRSKLLSLYESLESTAADAGIALGRAGIEDIVDVNDCQDDGILKAAIKVLQEMGTTKAKGASGKQAKLV